MRLPIIAFEKLKESIADALVGEKFGDKVIMIVGEAYSALSDPHERKWYDQHREEILRGPIDLSSRGQSEYLSAEDLIPNRARQAFNNYDDESDGFYSVFENLYLQIDFEEKKAFTNDLFVTATKENPSLSFGNDNTHIDLVLEFYNRFSTFSTVKSFSWYDLYNSIDFGDRNSRRIADRANKKERERNKKNFNAAVIELTTWLKKLSPNSETTTFKNSKFN